MRQLAYFALILSGISLTAQAATDHYFRREGGLVQHLKLTTKPDESEAMVDVDYDGSTGEAHTCSAQITDDAKQESPGLIVMKKQIEGEARYCTVTIRVDADSATIEESKDCEYFHGDACPFGSDNKPLSKIK